MVPALYTVKDTVKFPPPMRPHHMNMTPLTTITKMMKRTTTTTIATTTTSRARMEERGGDEWRGSDREAAVGTVITDR